MPAVPDPPLETYSRAFACSVYGDPLWEPTPIKLADVGYIDEGRFHPLFSAGLPLGTRKLGIDVPSAFEPLGFGQVVRSQPRPPDCLRTSTVKEVPRVGEPGVRIILELSPGKGAALITTSSTHGEDFERHHAAEAYTKKHYNSWVDFARQRGHGGENLQPILVTGVDRTREFGMVAYSHIAVRMECEFTAAVPGFAPTSISLRGREHTEGLVRTNCGSQSMAMEPARHQSLDTVSNEHDPCVFVRYYTMRRKYFFPKIIRAGAGPHNAGDRDREDRYPDSLVKARGNGSSDSDSLARNPSSDAEDFDLLAGLVFRGTNAESIPLHRYGTSHFQQYSANSIGQISWKIVKY